MVNINGRFMKREDVKIFALLDHRCFPAKEQHYMKTKDQEAEKIDVYKFFKLYDLGIKILPPLTIT